ncbi:MAG: DJ-1/PfpI family protein [Ferruginibacter sp.]|nr:DJ-1/PfpI family protein [Ferruginibacter sp.]
MQKTKFIFLILPQVHLLDLAGPDQVISEAIDFGADFEIEYAGIEESIQTSAGLGIGPVKHFSKIKYKTGDYIIIPGSRVKYIFSESFKKNTALFKWLATARQNNIDLVSICVGAFVLAEAGVLDGMNCTTHFQLTEKLQEKYPELKVKNNVLFVSEDKIHTSAGIASGIDLMLYLLEKLKGSFFAHKVARELVVYNRRAGMAEQLTAHFNYRNHIHSGIHKVQDHIASGINKKHSLAALAEIACMSERNFTRIFKNETGLPVNAYIREIRLEKIKELLNNPDISKKQIAAQVGLGSERQLERIINLIG